MFYHIIGCSLATLVGRVLLALSTLSILVPTTAIGYAMYRIGIYLLILWIQHEIVSNTKASAERLQQTAAYVSFRVRDGFRRALRRLWSSLGLACKIFAPPLIGYGIVVLLQLLGLPGDAAPDVDLEG